MNGNDGLSFLESRLESCKLISKLSAIKNNYVLQSSLNVNGDILAVGLSNYKIQIYNQQDDLSCIFAHEKEVSCVKFSSIDPNILLSSSLDGKLVLWDLRCQKSVQTFIDDSDGPLKPLTCFDYDRDETYLCAGTELVREDSFLLFWDKRSSALLGGYWNSHTDDISEVHFNPEENSCLASSSADGLINVFDLNEASEEDALQHTLNIGSGIAKFNWKNREHLSCTTSLEEYQLWSVTEGSPDLSTTREELSKHYQIPVDYLINSLLIDGTWYLASGSYDGSVHLWESKKRGLKPKYVLSSGHSDVVRTVSYSCQHKQIITGGEDGIVCRWLFP